MLAGRTVVTDTFPAGRGKIRIGWSPPREERLSERSADPSPSPEGPPPQSNRRGANVPWKAPGAR